MKTIKESIIESLSNAIAHDFSNFDPSTGLCANVYYDLKNRRGQITPDRTGSFVGPIYGTLQKAFTNWEHYSGILGYPIPSTDTKMSPIDIYRYSRTHKSMYVGDYGELRKQLAVWTVNYLKDT